MERAIGVFDSGVGGLTVAREIMRQLPNENMVYFGDTARVPYGSKSRETIIRYSRQIIRFLQEQQVKAIVVACNTASAFALDAVRDEFDIPIIGVIEPGARVAAEQTRNMDLKQFSALLFKGKRQSAYRRASARTACKHMSFFFRVQIQHLFPF